MLMKPYPLMKPYAMSISAAALLLLLSGCSFEAGEEAGAEQGSPPFADLPALEIEETGKSESLKGLYRDSWVFVHDLNFNTLTRGKVMVVDALGENKNYRGQIDADQFATFVQSSKRNELYVAETFYTRGTRGKRTDVVTIYDQDTLKSTGEVVLPNSNRAMAVTHKNAFRLTNDQKFALIFTFTPATGVVVVDLDSKKVVNEIGIPGCSLIYPMGPRGFASLCGDGTMAGFNLDAGGKVTGTTETEPFNDIDNDAMFMKVGLVGDTSYFPTFHGSLQAVTLGGDAPEVGPRWNFAGDSGWGPSGWQVITADVNGLVYVLMREDIKEGDHKIGGSEVWVLDPVKQSIIRKIKLVNGGFSIEATRAKEPLLIVTNASMGLDVYDLSSGDEHLREIAGFHASEGFAIHAVEMP